MSIEFSRWPNNYMMSYQVTKALGMASLGATDVTEIYEACKKIDPNELGPDRVGAPSFVEMTMFSRLAKSFRALPTISSLVPWE